MGISDRRPDGDSRPLTPLRLKPGARGIVSLGKALPKIPKGREAFLNVHFRTRAKTSWAPKDHLVAWEQIPLTPAPRPPAKAASLPAEVVETAGTVTFASAAWQLTFDRQIGFLGSLVAEGKEWLHAGPRLQIWRAATDNDGIKLWDSQEGKALRVWRDAGLDKLQLRLETIEVVKTGGKGAPIAVRTVHRGLGTASCGPDTLPQYLLSGREHRFAYRVSILR
jgi:beta-galactosidase